jgi:hypothetical protein
MDYDYLPLIVYRSGKAGASTDVVKGDHTVAHPSPPATVVEGKSPTQSQVQSGKGKDKSNPDKKTIKTVTAPSKTSAAYNWYRKADLSNRVHLRKIKLVELHNESPRNIDEIWRHERQLKKEMDELRPLVKRLTPNRADSPGPIPTFAGNAWSRKWASVLRIKKAFPRGFERFTHNFQAIGLQTGDFSPLFSHSPKLPPRGVWSSRLILFIEKNTFIATGDF